MSHSAHRRPWPWSLLLLLLLSGAALGQYHEDPAYGFKIRPPEDFQKQKPGSNKWILAEFLSKKETHQLDEDGWSMPYKPEMTVVGFVHAVIENSGKTTAKTEDGTVVITSFSTPYKDYKDFLKRTYSGGGYYFSAEESEERDGIQVDQYEVKVEKLTWGGPRRLIAWVYHLEDVDVAVQFEIQEKSWSKLRGELISSLRSFKSIERTEALPTGKETTTSTVLPTVSRIDWDKLSQEERTDLRQKAEDKAQQKAVREMPKGWRKFEVGRMLVLDSVDRKLATKLAWQCQAIQDWLSENFYFIGPGEYVRAPILKVSRVQPDEEGWRIILGGLLDDIEIEYEHDPNWLGEWEYERVNDRATELWFHDRDRDFYWAMPYWVRHGLDDLLQNSRLKGKKLDFQWDTYDLRSLKLQLAQDEFPSAKDLMLMDREQISKNRDAAAALVRFLAVGPGSKKKSTRQVFWKYLQALQVVTAQIKEREEREDPKTDDRPKTEAEEDEYYKKSQSAWKDKEREVLDAAFQATFSGWDDKDWKALDKAFQRTIDD